MKITNNNCINTTPESNRKRVNFQHAIRVSICIKSPETLKHTFIQPEDALYKNLHSRIVGWLNEGFLDNIKTVFNIKKKHKNKPTLKIKQLVNDLKLLDSDYNAFNTVRTAYRKKKIPYLVTGRDEAVVESLLNSKAFGTLKHDSLLLNGYSKSFDVHLFGQAFKNAELNFITKPTNLLRSKNGKEIMLRANFAEKVDAKGRKSYDLDSYQFCEIKLSKPLTQLEMLLVARRKKVDATKIQMANIDYKLKKYKVKEALTEKDYLKILKLQKKVIRMYPYRF